MLAALYRGAFVLAESIKSSTMYAVFTIIPLLNATIEAPDNARGLQCHTAQFTFKLIFDIDRRQQELLLSACSEAEESTWKDMMKARIIAETQDSLDGRENSDVVSLLNPTLKSMGPAFGPFTNFSRRLSIQRAATLGPKSNLQQVIIKNTEAPRYTSSASSFVMRSQSHMSSGHIPTLAPRRQDRIKLEIAAADMWTKSALPWPGMTSKRLENPIRSANHVMRKLSIASMTSMTSFASSFSKRSTSHATPRGGAPAAVPAGEDGGYASSSGQSGATVRAQRPSEKRKPVVVDFHSTPKAFLPEDFELDIKPTRRARKISARLSMMVESEDADTSRVLESAVVQQAELPKGDTSSAVEVGALTLSFGSDGIGETESGNNVANQGTIRQRPKTRRSEMKSTGSGETVPLKRLEKTRKALLRFFI
jgi:hypothetical protein